MSKRVFWIFGVLQSVSLGMIIFLGFRTLNSIKGASTIGLDTHVLMSTAFPLFLLLVQYTIFTKRN